MNTASSPLDPYHSALPHNGDPNYTSLPMQSYYVEGYPPHPASGGAMMDQMPQMPMSDGLAPLAPLTPGPQKTQPDLRPRSFVENGRKYELQVVQEPRRARMCGFGDKDRRPITPPPCVRLIITDIVSGKEVDCNEIDHGMFVLNVDLWTPAGSCEVNLVRQVSPSASISSTALAAYSDVSHAAAAYTSNSNAMRNEPSTPHFNMEAVQNQGSPFQPQAQAPPQSPYSPYPGPPQQVPYPQSPSQLQYGEMYPQGFSQPQMMNAPGFPQNTYEGGFYTTGAGIHAQGQGAQPGMEYGMVPQPLMGQPGMNPYDGLSYPPNQQDQQRMQGSTTHPGGMFTRNLIGSLAASAFRLTDPDDRIGIWFVLQDLSVRTEGQFRLRFSFVNVGGAGAPNTPAVDANSAYIPSGLINTGTAPVLASCFSETFTVYSAKKFPGVVDSTALSKCFATQGIKIPIRKESKAGKDREEYDED